MFCPKCGCEQANDNMFCENCGCVISEETTHQEEVVSQPVSVMSTETVKKRKNGRKSKKPLIVGLLVLIAVIITGTVFTVYGWNDEARFNRQLALGDRYMDELKYELAVAAYTKALEIEPRDIDATCGLARAYAGMEEYDKAEEVLLAQLAEYEKEAYKSSHEELYATLADIYLEDKNYNKAFAAIQRGAARVDSDGDGLPDYYERYLGMDPKPGEEEDDEEDREDVVEKNVLLSLKNVPDVVENSDILWADFDGDGLTNEEELLHSTDPFWKDTDGDGLADGEEVLYYGTNPLKKDTDGDGLFDGTEVWNGFDPNQEDTDGNGTKDGEEEFGRTLYMPSIGVADVIYPVAWVEGKGEAYGEMDAAFLSSNISLRGIGSVVGIPCEFMGKSSMKKVSIGFCVPAEKVTENIVSGNLQVTGYDYEKNQLIGHDTYIKYNSDGSVLLLADVSDAGTYMLIDSRRFKRDISAQDYSGIIESGKADVIFVIDSTGSMSGPISNVRENIVVFSDYLAELGVDVRVGIVEYKDIYEDGKNSTHNYGFYYDLEEFKQVLCDFYVSGGGDSDETAVDALEVMRNSEFRSGVNKYAILITDAGYKNGTLGDAGYTMEQVIEELQRQNICTSVVTASSNYSEYQQLAEATGGEICNIKDDFAEALQGMMDKMGTRGQDGTWVRLTNGSVVCLEVDPTLGDKKVDSDGDGIPDLKELGAVVEVTYRGGSDEEEVTFEAYSFSSNPALKDLDGDGYADDNDSHPMKNEVAKAQLTDFRGYILVENGEDGVTYGVAKDTLSDTPMNTGEIALENFLLYVQKHGGYSGLTGVDVSGDSCEAYEIQYLTERLRNLNNSDYRLSCEELLQDTKKLAKIATKMENRIQEEENGSTYAKDMNAWLSSVMSGYNSMTYYMPLDVYSGEEIYHQICQTIDSDCPVMLQTGVAGNMPLYDSEELEDVALKIDSLEWMTVIGCKKDSVADRITLTVVYNGKMYYIDFDKLMETNGFLGGIVGVILPTP